MFRFVRKNFHYSSQKFPVIRTDLCGFCFKYILILLSAISFLFPFKTDAQNIEFDRINSLDGLSHSTVYDIIQDGKGFLWFATREGLNKYDGYKLTTYYSGNSKNLSTGLLDNEINKLAFNQGGLFIGSQKGLNKYLPEQDKFISIFNGDSITDPVKALYPDASGNLFIGTNKSLFLLDNKGILKRIRENINVKSIAEYKTNIYWVVLSNRILLINIHGEIIKQYPVSYIFKDHPDIRMNVIFKDSEENIFLGTSAGLYRFVPEEDQFRDVEIDQEHKRELESKVVRAISEDKLKRLWIGTENGIFIYSKHQKNFTHYTQSFNNIPGSLSDKSVYSIFIAADGRTWIGTYFGGVNYTKITGHNFKTLIPSETQENSLKGKAISEIIKYKERIWVATEDGGINIYDALKEDFDNLSTEDGLTSNNIHALYADKDENLWIGTFLGGLNKYEPHTGKIISFQQQPDDARSISNNYIYSILQDVSGKLWIGTQRGLNIFDYKTNTFSLFKPEEFESKFIYDIIQDRDTNLWYCTRYSGIYKYSPSTGRLEHFTTENGLSSDQVISARETSDGNIWFGTLNGGLIKHDKESGTFRSFTRSDGLINNNVYAILEADDNSIWFSSNRGLTNMDKEGKIISNYSSEDGLSTNQFNFRSGFKDDKGYMYFGSINGINIFHPDSLKQQIPKPKIHFTSFRLFNQPVNIGEAGILEKHIDHSDTITLKYDENVLAFEFAAVNYPYKKEYNYFLQGFDKTWNKVGEKNAAHYTNLAPGEYDFVVKVGPEENMAERSIHLSILPPFWQTGWAYIGYLIILGLMVYFTWRLIRYINRQKLAVKFEKFERQKLTEINQHKLDFFTFISHEFKTPLTIIIASLEKFMQKWPGNSTTTVELNSVKRSVSRLQHLIHQLMEFRKTEDEHAKLELRKGNIILFLQDTFYAFAPLMNAKKIDYKFKPELEEYTCYFDPSKLEMIITNILSNAIKNTPETGKIIFKAGIDGMLDAENRAILKLVIEDTGYGVPAENIPVIFEPYFKKDPKSNGHNWTGGSGLGLALVKSLLNLLKGEIDFYSRENEGSKITLRIPLNLKCKDTDGIQELVVGNKNVNIDPHLILEDYEKIEEKNDSNKNFTLMIVEDNPQIIKLMQSHFSTTYKIITAKNGKAALKKIENHIPDIIISDLIMPELDGISFCKQIRKSPETSHIPFLLITGKEEKVYKLEGLRVGANAIINKPFSLSELDLIVKNLLETHQNKIRRFSGVELKEIKTPKNNQNEEFLKKVNDLIYENYSNPGFNIENLAQMMGISRSLLHIKMKKNIGSSASNYLKGIRIKKAAELIKQGVPISEVAYKTGYNDPNYFSRVFKKEFNVSPTDYKKD